MRKVALVFGLLAGVLVSVFMVITVKLCERDAINFDKSDFIGYGSMVIALSMIFSESNPIVTIISMAPSNFARRCKWACSSPWLQR